MRKLFFIFLLLPHLLLAEEAIPKFDTKSVLDGVNAKGAMQLVYLGYTRGVADAILATNTFNNAEAVPQGHHRQETIYAFPSSQNEGQTQKHRLPRGSLDGYPRT